MTDATAIRALREQVEAGEHRAGMWGALRTLLHPHAPEYARQAFLGSLDAAKALHEALLHERAFVEIHFTKRYEDESRVSIHVSDKGWHSTSSTPARAWLIAILRALEAQGAQKGESDG